MIDIQHKSTKPASHKIEENGCSTFNWPEGASEQFNAKYKAWEIRRGFAIPETKNNYYKRSQNRLFKGKKPAK